MNTRTVLLTIAATVAGVTPAFAQSSWPYYTPMHNLGWMFFGFLSMVVFWSLAAVGAFTIGRWLMSRAPTDDETTDEFSAEPKTRARS